MSEFGSPNAFKSVQKPLGVRPVFEAHHKIISVSDDNDVFPLGAYHGADVQYLLNRNGEPAPFTPDQQLLSQAMISYWTHFAKRGNPNSKATPHWARYDPTSDERQSFVPPTPTVESGSTFDSFHMCSAYWDVVKSP